MSWSATGRGRCSRPRYRPRWAAYVDAFADQLDQDGRRLVVRNGYHQPREVSTAAGAVPVKAPRVNDQRVDEATGERARFSSKILPAWARKSPQVAEVLPLLYLHGLSSSDFGPALTQFLGSGAGLSAATITRLTSQWQDEAAAFGKRSLAGTDYVYMWVDGIHLKVRLTQDKVCLLVMIGVRADGTKELIALADGHRESSESWADLLRDCKRPRDESAGPGRWGRGARVLEGRPGGVPRDPGAALLVPQDRQRPELFTEVGTAGREGRPRGDLAGRGQGPRRQSRHVIRGRVRHEVAQGRRENHRGPRRAPHVLRLPGRALGPPAHHEPHRVDFRPPSGWRQRVTKGPRLAGCWDRDGVQADRVSPRPVAGP